MWNDFDDIALNIKMRFYPLIGSGTGRSVYDMENGYVVKAARNRKGIEQNKAEYHIASMNHSGIFANIKALSDDNKYLIMEKAEKINSFTVIWKYYHVKNNRELFRLDDFKNITKEYNLLLPDLYRQSSWGLVKGRPVIIDFGYTKEVREYYRHFL